MKNYKLIIIFTLGLTITVVTTWKWQQITKVKNEIRSEIQKSTLKAQESLVYLKELSKEKSNFTKKILISDPKGLSQIQNELQILEESSLKSQNEFSQWEKSLSSVNNHVAEYLIQELKIKKANTYSKNKIPINDLIKNIEIQDQKLDTSLKAYETLWSKRQSLIEKLKRLPFSKKEAFLVLPNSPIYEKLLQRSIQTQ